MIERTFSDIVQDSRDDAHAQAHFGFPDFTLTRTWDDLLLSKRILLIGEAGSGKTFECFQQTKRLRAAGKPAFFLELAGLANSELDGLLDPEERHRLQRWRSSQSETAMFFLDSIDELKLTLGSFEKALKRFRLGIHDQLRRAIIVLTSRPVPFERQLIREILPVPTDEAFKLERFSSVVAVDDKGSPYNPDKPRAWRVVGLQPLSNREIGEFAQAQGVSDADALLADLLERNAMAFARRPQDLIEICADWREHRRVRTHYDQVISNVQVKSRPSSNRREAADLSDDMAIEGAGRLALSMLLIRCLTIRYNDASDGVGGEPPLRPEKILSDWSAAQRNALLERPLFSFATYGRVRFHHRSVLEFLAAKRLERLRDGKLSSRALKRLLCTQARGRVVVRPSMRPVAAWLALSLGEVFELLRDNDPSVLITEGDPGSLTRSQRVQTLRAFVGKFSDGGPRGFRTTPIQLQRFASMELAEEIWRLWNDGVENPEVRRLILHIIAAGRIRQCADIAHAVAFDASELDWVRGDALETLVALDSPKLHDVATAVATGAIGWTGEVATDAVLNLFPRTMSVDQLCDALSRMEKTPRLVIDRRRMISDKIEEAPLSLTDLALLRNRLVDLITEDFTWGGYPCQIESTRSFLAAPLVATCVRGLAQNADDDWLYASAIAVRVVIIGEPNPQAKLRERLVSMDAESNARHFDLAASRVRSLHEIAEPLIATQELLRYDYGLVLTVDRDLGWIKDRLADPTRSIDDKVVLLRAALEMISAEEHGHECAVSILPFVAGEQTLGALVEKWLSLVVRRPSTRRWRRLRVSTRHTVERSLKWERVRWARLWRQVFHNPGNMFSTDRSKKTVLGLWRAMTGDREKEQGSPGWNRRFIEDVFDIETADRLRLALMRTWRENCPPLPSQQSKNDRGTSNQWCELGLAGLYAEAEAAEWASGLSPAEGPLATRYALIDQNGMPYWAGDLARMFPAAIDSIIGAELELELKGKPIGLREFSLLRHTYQMPAQVGRLLIPRFLDWLVTEQQVENGVEASAVAGRLGTVTTLVLKHGDEVQRSRLRTLATQRLDQVDEEELAQIWLAVLMMIDPDAGVTALGRRLLEVEPSSDGVGVNWFSELFKNVGLRSELDRFPPSTLLRLVRIAFQHVRPEHDIDRTESYSIDTRHGAENARGSIQAALVSAHGEEAWVAKMEMVADPAFVSSKDWLMAISDEYLAEEIDAVAFDYRQVEMLDKVGEAPSTSNEAIFQLLMDRLDDLDNLLLEDISPKEAWAGFTTERLMRREIARELKHTAKGLYHIDQETVTAEENETDIRLLSTIGDREAVIELKIGDKRSARDLRDTIHGQLVKKYMSPENCRAGCLLVTLSKRRTWHDPETGASIGLEGLRSLLGEEAQRVQAMLAGKILLGVHILDLTPRLSRS